MRSQRIWTSYDEEADVLYLDFKKPSHADDTELTENDVLIRYEKGEVVGVTILHARQRCSHRWLTVASQHNLIRACEIANADLEIRAIETEFDSLPEEWLNPGYHPRSPNLCVLCETRSALSVKPRQPVN